MEKVGITERTKINRLPKRGFYDKETIYKILDEAFICHIGFKLDDEVFIIPTAFGREDDSLFIHASKNSRLLTPVRKGEDICINVTLTDAIVLARSAFHHSINYRSVVLFGKGKEVTESSDKTNALKVIVEHIIPGRWEDIRKPDEKELYATAVFQFKINEASAKVRTGYGSDDNEDMDLNIWAGILPLKLTAEQPVKDPSLKEGISIPSYLMNYKRRTDQ